MKENTLSAAGFTLVELIVVIAVLAILAAVAVPAYSGYIARANDTVAEAELETLRTAAISAAILRRAELYAITVTSEGSVTVWAVEAYGPDGLTVASCRELELQGFHEGIVHGIGRHSYYSGGCTWTVSDGFWAAGVEKMPGKSG